MSSRHIWKAAFRRVDPERPAPPAALRGAPARQDGQRMPPRAARTGRGRPSRSATLDPPGRRPPCRWRNTTPSATSPRPASRPGPKGEAAQAADLRRAGAPRLGPALRLPPGGRRRPQELVGPQGAVDGPVGEAAGRPGRGPPDRLRDLRGHDPRRASTAAARSRSGTTAPTRA